MTRTVKIALLLLFLISLKIASGAYEGLSPNAYKIRSGTIGDGTNSSGAGTTLGNYTFWGILLGTNVNTCTAAQASSWNGSWWTCAPIPSLVETDPFWNANYSAFQTLNNVNRSDFSVACDLDGNGAVVGAGYSCRYVIPFYASIYEVHFAADLNTTTNWTISKATKPSNNSPPVFSVIAYQNYSNVGWNTNSSINNTFINDDLILIRMDANDNATHPGLYVDMRKQ